MSFRSAQRRGVQIVHVIPKTLTAQGGGRSGRSRTKWYPVPGAELAFAGRGQRQVQGDKKEVLAHQRSLGWFARMGVDGSKDVQLLRCVPKRGGGTEIPLLGVEGTSRSLGEEFEQQRDKEMAQDEEERKTELNEKGYDEATEEEQAEGVGKQARQDTYIHNLGEREKEKHKRKRNEN